MWNNFVSWYAALESPVRASIISACATIAAASVAAFVVFIQIGRQAAKARENNRHNEELKLKLEIYNRILKVCEQALDAEIEISQYVRGLSTSILVARMAQTAGRQNIPKERFTAYQEKWFDAQTNAIAVITAVENWGIIDPRMEVFQTAINAALFDARKAQDNYFSVALKIFPAPMPTDPDKLFPWSPPDDTTAAELQAVGDAFLDRLSSISMYVHDFRVEMQKLLVGSLFPKNKLKVREPIDSALQVIELARSKELMKYFHDETEWGKAFEKTHEDVRQQLLQKAKDKK